MLEARYVEVLHCTKMPCSLVLYNVTTQMGHGFESCAVNQYDRYPNCNDKVFVFVPAYGILLIGLASATA